MDKKFIEIWLSHQNISSNFYKINRDLSIEIEKNNITLEDIDDIPFSIRKIKCDYLTIKNSHITDISFLSDIECEIKNLTISGCHNLKSLNINGNKYLIENITLKNINNVIHDSYLKSMSMCVADVDISFFKNNNLVLETRNMILDNISNLRKFSEMTYMSPIKKLKSVALLNMKNMEMIGETPESLEIITIDNCKKMKSLLILGDILELNVYHTPIKKIYQLPSSIKKININGFSENEINSLITNEELNEDVSQEDEIQKYHDDFKKISKYLDNNIYNIFHKESGDNYSFLISELHSNAPKTFSYCRYTLLDRINHIFDVCETIYGNKYHFGNLSINNKYFIEELETFLLENKKIVGESLLKYFPRLKSSEIQISQFFNEDDFLKSNGEFNYITFEQILSEKGIKIFGQNEDIIFLANYIKSHL